jgi:hypothetical protein
VESASDQAKGTSKATLQNGKKLEEQSCVAQQCAAGATAPPACAPACAAAPAPPIRTSDTPAPLACGQAEPPCARDRLWRTAIQRTRGTTGPSRQPRTPGRTGRRRAPSDCARENTATRVLPVGPSSVHEGVARVRRRPGRQPRVEKNNARVGLKKTQRPQAVASPPGKRRGGVLGGFITPNRSAKWQPSTRRVGGRERDGGERRVEDCGPVLIAC